MTDASSRSCEECHQSVSQAQVRRHGDGVAMFGRILWISGLLLVVGGPAFGCAVMRTNAPALLESVGQAKQDAVESLRRIDGLPPDLIDRFESTSLIPADARNGLTPEQRAEVDDVLGDFLLAGAGVALRGTAAVGFIGLGVVAALILGFPMLIGGLLLARNTTIWTCDVCHHVQGGAAGKCGGGGKGGKTGDLDCCLTGTPGVGFDRVMAITTQVTRREFLAQLSSVGLVLSAAQQLRAQGRLATRVIPTSGESLPVVGLGSSKAVLQLPDAGPDPLLSVMRMLVQHGGRVVDTSPRTEAIDAMFGEILDDPDLRDELFLAVKINTPDKDEGVAQFRHSQRLFNRRTVDLLQVESLRGVESHWPSVRGWKDTGEARHIGVTVSSYTRYEQFEAFMRNEPLDFVHVNYSIVERHAEDRLLPLAQELGMAVIINRPFMNGSYFGRVSDRTLPTWADDFDCSSWAQFSLKYILSNPAVTCVLTETTNPEHMEENLQAGIGPLPDAATRQRMRNVIEEA